MSRTLGGISDVSTSPAKEGLVLSGEALATKAGQNFSSAVSMLLSEKRGVILGNPQAAESLVIDVFLSVNEGLLQKGRPILRTWETNIPGQTKITDLQGELDLFYSEFVEKFNHRSIDPIAFAAWVEYRLNGEIHPFTDGCGRVSQALACFALGEAGLSYPNFPSREEFYARISEPFASWLEYYRSRVTT